MEQPPQGFAPMMKQMFMGLGALSKAFYGKYGEEALPIITEVASQGGVEYGKMMQQMTSARDMKTVGESLKMMGSTMGMNLEIMELSDNVMRFKTGECPLGIQGTSKGLCQALMTNDQKMVGTFLGQDVDMQILKSIAAGDKECEITFSKK